MSLSYSNIKKVKMRMPQQEKTFSKEKAEAIKQLQAKCDTARTQAQQAESMEQFFKKKIANTPGQQNDTLFGSALADHLFTRSKDKYHAVRWKAAKLAAKRRFHRLTKLIQRKCK